MFAVVTSGISGAALAAIFSAATALAVAGGAFYRRRVKRTRSEWRQEDRVKGWRDENGAWHLGVSDVVLGWTDSNGGEHPGLDRRVATLEVSAERHRADPTAHARGT